MAVASLLALSLGGCECERTCTGFSLEVFDIETGEVVEEFEVAYAESIYGPRSYAGPTGDTPGFARISDSGYFRVWVRAAGYRQWYGSVDAPETCTSYGSGCPSRLETVELVPL